MLPASQFTLRIGKVCSAVIQILDIAKADIIIVAIHQPMSKEGHHHLIFIVQIILFQMLHKTNLWIVFKKGLQFFTKVMGRNRIIIQILKPLVEQFKQRCTVQTFTLR